MISQLLNFSTILIIFIGITASIILWWRSRKCDDKLIRGYCYAAIAMYLVIATMVELGYYVIRYDRVEVLHMGYFIGCYIGLQIFYLSLDSTFEQSWTKNPSVWVTCNTFPAIYILLNIFNVYILDHKLPSFYSYSQAFGATGFDEFHLICRLLAMAFTTYYIALLSFFILDSYRKRRARAHKLEYDKHRLTWLERDAMIWIGLIIAAFVGVFLPSALYQLALRALIIWAVIDNALGNYKLITGYDAMHGDMSSKDPLQVISFRLYQWLEAEEFPLSHGVPTIETVAQQAGITEESFTKYLYEYKSMTFTEWVSEQKMVYCKRLLMNSDLNVSEVAYKAGYSNVAAMNRAFSRRYGMSPTEMRNKGKVDDMIHYPKWW